MNISAASPGFQLLNPERNPNSYFLQSASRFPSPLSNLHSLFLRTPLSNHESHRGPCHLSTASTMSWTTLQILSPRGLTPSPCVPSSPSAWFLQGVVVDICCFCLPGPRSSSFWFFAFFLRSHSSPLSVLKVQVGLFQPQTQGVELELRPGSVEPSNWLAIESGSKIGK